MAEFEVFIDAQEFVDKAAQLGAAMEQVPYALALSLNAANEKAREHLIDETWPSSVNQVNTRFIAVALRRGPRAWKDNLTVSVFDQLGRANLKKHDEGGTRVARLAHLAIPTINTRRTQRGFLPRPKDVPHKVVDATGIWSRVGKRKPQLKLMYTFKRQVQIKPDVPFTKDFQAVIEKELRIAFPEMIAKAMATAR